MLKRRHLLQEGDSPGKGLQGPGQLCSVPGPIARGHCWGTWPCRGAGALGALARRSVRQQHSLAVRQAQQEFYFLLILKTQPSRVS